MKSSPDAAALVGVALAGEREGALDRRRGRSARAPSTLCSAMTASRSPSSARSLGGELCGRSVSGARFGRRRSAPTRVCPLRSSGGCAVRLLRACRSVSPTSARPASPVLGGCLGACSVCLAFAQECLPSSYRCGRREALQSLEIVLRGYDPKGAGGDGPPPSRPPELLEHPQASSGDLGRARVAARAVQRARAARRRPSAARLASAAAASQGAKQRHQARRVRPLLVVHAKRQLDARPRPRRDAGSPAGGGRRLEVGEAARVDERRRGRTRGHRRVARQRGPIGEDDAASRPRPRAATAALGWRRRPGGRRRSPRRRRRTAPGPRRARPARGGEARRRRGRAPAPPLEASSATVATPEAPRRSIDLAARRRHRRLARAPAAATRRAAPRARRRSVRSHSASSGSAAGLGGAPRRVHRVELAEHDARRDRALPLVELELRTRRRRARRSVARRGAVDAEGDARARSGSRSGDGSARACPPRPSAARRRAAPTAPAGGRPDCPCRTGPGSRAARRLDARGSRRRRRRRSRSVRISSRRRGPALA